MKLLSILSVVSLLCFLGFIMPNKYDHPSRGEQLVNATLAKTAQIIKDKYHLKPCSVGAAMPGGPIRKLILGFDTKTLYTRNELRKLLIQCAQEMIDQVNANEEIQPFLMKAPFTIENVQITIFNQKPDGRIDYDPEIVTAGIICRVLTYRTKDPEDHYKYKNHFTESYEEALKLLESQ